MTSAVQIERPSAANALELAISAHDAEAIRASSQQGCVLSEGFDPVLAVASGVCSHELDQFHHQSAESVSATLRALREIGIGVDEERDGVPAAHRLIEFYGPQIIDQVGDYSMAGLNGLSDQEQSLRLAAFAAHGVDFTAIDADGRKPFQRLQDMAVKADEAEALNWGHMWGQRLSPEAQTKKYADHIRENFAPVRLAGKRFRLSGRPRVSEQKARVGLHREQRNPNRSDR